MESWLSINRDFITSIPRHIFDFRNLKKFQEQFQKKRSKPKTNKWYNTFTNGQTTLILSCWWKVLEIVAGLKIQNMDSIPSIKEEYLSLRKMIEFLSLWHMSIWLTWTKNPVFSGPFWLARWFAKKKKIHLLLCFFRMIHYENICNQGDIEWPPK